MMESGTASTTGSSSSSSFVGTSSSSRHREKYFITSIPLNGNNYVIWA